MKKNSFTQKLKIGFFLCCLFLFGLNVITAQTVSDADKAATKERIDRMESQSTMIFHKALRGLKKQLSISDNDFNEFKGYYGDTLSKNIGDIRYYILSHPVMDDLQVKEYAIRLKNRYVELFNNYKEIKAEFPSSVDEVLHPRTAKHNPFMTCNPACDNVDFSSKTLAAWNCAYADCSGENDGSCVETSSSATGGPSSFSYTPKTPAWTVGAGVEGGGPDANTGKDYQDSIITGGNDPVVAASGGTLPMVCNGYTASCRVGDGANYNKKGILGEPDCGVAFLAQEFTVTAANVDFYYNYAVVLENPIHCFHQQPYFKIAMLDQNGDTIPHCGNYVAVAGSQTAGTGWNIIATDNHGYACAWLPWTTSYVSLKKYIGQCVTVVVQTSDCGQGGHFGYAYFDAQCKTLGIITSAPALCGNPIVLTAPSGGVSYQWISPGAGCMTPAAGNTQAITVNCPGKYSVIITTVAGASCADTLDTVITSSTATSPIPFFKSDTVCVGNPTQFTNLTTGGSASNTYVWTFQGGTTSSAANPSFTFPGGGPYPETYTVSLKAEGNGCGGDTTLKVVINGPPTAGFSANTVCQNSPTLFTNTSTGTATFKWNFGDGTTSTSPSPQHTYTVCGTFTVTLVAGTAPCVDSVKNTVTVNPNPAPAFTASPVCLGSNTQFNDVTPAVGCGGSITGWSWAFGDPGSGVNNTSTTQNPTHVFADTGCYSVLFKITTAGGCSDSTTKAVCIVGPPVPKFIATTVCLNSPTVFTNQTTPASSTSKWSFGDPANGTSIVTNPSYTYAAAGTYTVKLISTSGAGCVDSTTLSVTVNPPPTSGFTADTVCLGNPTAFTDTSHGGSSYAWRFGDAAKGTSAVQDPTYTYATAGTFQVTEVVTSASGCKDSITLPAVVNPAPTATITVPAVCLGTSSVFTLTPSLPCTYSWTMGDGIGTSTAQNPTYTYTTNGTFTANVILATTTGTCPGKASVVAIVNPIPVPNFTAPPVCQDQNAVFTNASTIANVPAPQSMTYAWSFGDNATSTATSPSHHYAKCGTFNVTLIATSAAGCMHDTTIPVIINPVPVPNFISTSVCKGLVTQFTDKSAIGCGDSVTKWNWNFGDGTAASTLQNPTHIYANSGTFNTTLTVTSKFGCDSSITIPVIVYPIPVPAFTANQPCFGSQTTFTDNSTVTGGTIAGEDWSFGDGGTGTGATISHTYAAAGSYNVELIVVSNHGCVDSITQPVIVNPIPVPGFFSDTVGCTTLCVTDSNTSSVAFPGANSITNYLWNFGDGSQDSSSTLAEPKHCYTQPGTYSVQLTVSTNNGCTATLVRPNYITAWPVPVACFTANPTTLQTLTDSTVFFTDCSSGNPVSWNWLSFGDPCDSSAITQNAVHTYQENCTHSFQDTGTYCTTLAIANKFGCKDTTTNCIHIGPMWTFYVPNAFTPNNDGLNDGFIPKAVGVIAFQMWIFDRWGQLLYHCTSLTAPWDGTVHTGPTSGAECQEDTYVWLVEFVDVFRNSHREVGRVSIIR